MLLFWFKLLFLLPPQVCFIPRNIVILAINVRVIAILAIVSGIVVIAIVSDMALCCCCYVINRFVIDFVVAIVTEFSCVASAFVCVIVVVLDVVIVIVSIIVRVSDCRLTVIVVVDVLLWFK